MRPLIAIIENSEWRARSGLQPEIVSLRPMSRFRTWLHRLFKPRPKAGDFDRLRHNKQSIEYVIEISPLLFIKLAGTAADLSYKYDKDLAHIRLVLTPAMSIKASTASVYEGDVRP